MTTPPPPNPRTQSLNPSPLTTSSDIDKYWHAKMKEFNTSVQEAKTILTTATTSIKLQLNGELAQVKNVITTESDKICKTNITLLNEQGTTLLKNLSEQLNTEHTQHTQSNTDAWAKIKTDMTNSQTQLVNTNKIAIKITKLSKWP